ncbi:MAG TPA: hypothetical protein H9675_01040 [Firmicutes bacterium]|nr:hypothetical protein [Bacillota bacterium]
MPEIIFFVIALFLAVIGFTEVIRYITYVLLVPKCSRRGLMLLPLKYDDAEIRLRAAVEKMNLFGHGCYNKIIAIDCGMSPETLEICEEFISTVDAIKLIDSSELNDYVEKELIKSV